MKKILRILVLLVVFLNTFSCKKSSGINKDITEKIEVIEKEKLVKDHDFLSRKVVEDFYMWYINDVYMKRIYDYDHARYKKIGDK